MYSTGIYITDPVGNNELSYSERIYLGSVGEIFVPSLIRGSLDNLEPGSEIVFEEVVNNKIISCTGLKHFVQLEYQGIPVYIVDNHNHALSFRYQHRLLFGSIEHLTIIHIDQHADTKPNENIIPITNSQYTNNNEIGKDICEFVNNCTNVGNFITAAMNAGIVDDVMQVRTEHALQQLKDANIHDRQRDERHQGYIVDIDVDFRDGREIAPEEIQIIRDLIKKAKLVTIATSPYFMDQKRAIAIVKKILQ